MNKLKKKRRDADLFSDIENIHKIKHTRKDRHKKIFSFDVDSDSLSDDVDSYRFLYFL